MTDTLAAYDLAWRQFMTRYPLARAGGKLTCYGCVLCQCEHRRRIDPEYTPHLYRQSKHGTYERVPMIAESLRVIAAA